MKSNDNNIQTGVSTGEKKKHAIETYDYVVARVKHVCKTGVTRLYTAINKRRRKQFHFSSSRDQIWIWIRNDRIDPILNWSTKRTHKTFYWENYTQTHSHRGSNNNTENDKSDHQFEWAETNIFKCVCSKTI